MSDEHGNMFGEDKTTLLDGDRLRLSLEEMFPIEKGASNEEK